MTLCERLGFALLDLATGVVFRPHRRPQDRPQPADIGPAETEDLRTLPWLDGWQGISESNQQKE